MDESTALMQRDRRAGSSFEVITAHPQFSSWETPPREPHLLDYWRILRKYQWSILSFLLTVVTFVTIATLRMHPVYEATARVEIDNENTNFLPFKSDSYEMYMDIENYIEQNFRSKYLATTTASNWLKDQLNELQFKVEKSEDARIAYERQNQIWNIDEKQNITQQKLSDLNKELTQAQGERMRSEALYQLVGTGHIDALPPVRDSLLLQDLQKKQSELNTQYIEALNQYGPSFPKVMRLQAQLKEIEHLIAREKANIVNRIEAEYQTARQRETLLSQALDKQKGESNAIAEKLVQLNILKHEAEAN